MRTAKYLICLVSAGFCSAAAFAVDTPGMQADNVRVDSLQVKERLHSMEQVNVSAAKDKLPEKTDSIAVQALLDEATALEQSQPAD